MNKYNLICMTFDGDYVIEHNIFSKDGTFDSIDAAWRRAGDMGSRWYFYPFYFVTGESSVRIVDVSDSLDFTVGKSIKTVKRFFKMVSELPTSKNLNPEQYISLLQDNGNKL